MKSFFKSVLLISCILAIVGFTIRTSFAFIDVFATIKSINNTKIVDSNSSDNANNPTLQVQIHKDKQNNSTENTTTKNEISKNDGSAKLPIPTDGSGTPINKIQQKDHPNIPDTQPQATVEDKGELYNLIKKNVENGNDTVINSSKISLNDLTALTNNVIDENGYSGYIESFEDNSKGKTLYLHFNYKGGVNSFLSKIKIVNNKVNSIVNSVVNNKMSDFEKELALHDYVVNHTAYDYDNLLKNTLPDDSFTAYGTLIKGVSVCQGYSKAMFRLLNAAGVKTLIVIGNSDGVPHAWNMVSIEGSYYQLDATFDDPISRNGQVLSHDYFNLTDTEISKNHSYNKSDYPSCTSTKYNYFVYTKQPKENP